MTMPTAAELEGCLAHVVDSPSEVGTVEMIVCRPDVDERLVLEQGDLVVGEGLVGDSYRVRGDRHTPDGSADPEAQLNVMNCRALDAVAAGDRQRWPLAGDQLLVDFDLSLDNLPTGTRLAVGGAVIEVSAKPHNGCAKFSQRFGVEATRWVNGHRDLRLRGINAMVVEPGTVRAGDAIRKL